MNLGSVSSLLAATLYQGNPDRNHKLWNIGLTKYTYSHIKITGARDTDLPPPLFFSNFLFTNLFSIKFLYFFIISSLFPYFDLFVSIFIQSYVNNNLHVSALYRYKSNILGTYSEHIFDSTQAPVCKCNRFPSRRRRRAALSI